MNSLLLVIYQLLFFSIQVDEIIVKDCIENKHFKQSLRNQQRQVLLLNVSQRIKLRTISSLNHLAKVPWIYKTKKIENKCATVLLLNQL